MSLLRPEVSDGESSLFDSTVAAIEDDSPLMLDRLVARRPSRRRLHWRGVSDAELRKIRSAAQKRRWAGMTKAERSAEAKRRAAVRRKVKEGT